MPSWPSDYIEKVVFDVEEYNGRRKVVRAGLFERCAVKHCSPDKLHANPEDEFSQPDIGPNLRIVEEYVEQIKMLQRNSMAEIFEEPMIVQKMEPDGYLLLNGHHRWFAALRMDVKKVHINIVNMISETDINRMMGVTDNTKLVTFDFDEVLLSIDPDNQAPLEYDFFEKIYSGRLRKGAPEVIKAFQSNGFDVCIYTAGYLSEDEFGDFFSMYDLKVNLIVNGLNSKRNRHSGKAGKLQEMLRNKYKLIAHVDDETVVYTNHVTKDFVVCEWDKDKEWQDGISEIIPTVEH